MMIIIYQLIGDIDIGMIIYIYMLGMNIEVEISWDYYACRYGEAKG